MYMCCYVVSSVCISETENIINKSYSVHDTREKDGTNTAFPAIPIQSNSRVSLDEFRVVSFSGSVRHFFAF
jgi:hypothetical protein